MSNVVEIRVKSKDQTKDGFAAADKRASSLGSKVAKGAKVAAAGLAVMGGAAVGAALKAEEVASANARVGNVLGNMGMEEATDRALAYAEALEMSLGVDEKVIKNTQAKLATFSELAESADEAGGAFDRATLAAVDMAAAGFGSAESNAVQLGKALQDPLKGITALNRSGVTFTEQQKKQIKTMVESGKVSEAQALILAEVEKQVGGTAEATADSSAKMKLAFGNVVETLGTALLPHMDKLAAISQKAADFMTEHSSVVMVGAGVLAGLAVTVIAVHVAMKIYAAGVAVVTGVTKGWAVAQKVLNAVMKMNPIGLIITAITALVGIILVIEKRTGFFSKVWGKAWGAIQRGAAAAFNWIRDHWPLLLAILTGPFGLAVLAILKNRNKIVGFFKSVPGAIKGAFKYLGSAITSPFTSAFKAIRSLWNSTIGGFGFSLPGWIPKVGGKSFHIPKMAHGGIGGGLVEVGEAGRELVRLPYGSTVIPHGQSEAMMSGGGSGGRTVLELRSSGSKLDDMLLELLRSAIRVRGGNVQIVLGR